MKFVTYIASRRIAGDPLFGKAGEPSIVAQFPCDLTDANIKGNFNGTSMYLSDGILTLGVFIQGILVKTETLLYFVFRITR